MDRIPETRSHPVVRQVVTRDADEHAANLRQWDQTYEQLTPGPFEGRLSEIWLDGIQFFREITSQSVHEAGSAWQGSRTFGVPLAMTGGVCYRGRSMGPDALLVLEGGEELDFCTAPRLDIVGITIPEEVYRRPARTEGILPALESSHALGHLAALAAEGARTVLVGLSGRGDKDLSTYQTRLES